MSLFKSRLRVGARWAARWVMFFALAAGVVAASPYIWRAVRWVWGFLPSADGWLVFIGLMFVASTVHNHGRSGGGR